MLHLRNIAAVPDLQPFFITCTRQIKREKILTIQVPRISKTLYKFQLDLKSSLVVCLYRWCHQREREGGVGRSKQGDPPSSLPAHLIAVMVNLSLYSIKAVLLLDAEGNRVLAKYYGSDYTTLKEQKAFEKGLFDKTKRAQGELRDLMLHAHARHLDL